MTENQQLLSLEAKATIVAAVGDALRMQPSTVIEQLFQKKPKVAEILSPIELKSLVSELRPLLTHEEAENLVETAHVSIPNFYAAAAEFKSAVLKFKHVIQAAARHSVYRVFDQPAFSDRQIEYPSLTVFLYPAMNNLKPEKPVRVTSLLTKSGKEKLKPLNTCKKIEGFPYPDETWSKGNCALNAKLFLIQALCKEGHIKAATLLAYKAMFGPLRDLLECLVLTNGKWSQEAENLRHWTIFCSYPHVYLNNWDTNAAWEEIFFSSQTVLLREEVCVMCEDVQQISSGPPHLSPEEALVVVAGEKAGLDPSKTCRECGAKGQIKARIVLSESVIALDFSHPGSSMGLPTLQEATQKGLLRDNFWMHDQEYVKFGAVVDEIAETEPYIRDGWPDDHVSSQYNEAKLVSAVKYNIGEPPLRNESKEEEEEACQQSRASSHNFFILSKDGKDRRICDASVSTSFDEKEFVETQGTRYTIQYLYFVPKSAISESKDEQGKIEDEKPRTDEKGGQKKKDLKEQTPERRETRSRTLTTKSSSDSTVVKKKLPLRDKMTDVSLFERMVINREGCITLQVQHRMAPEMAKLIVPTIYKTLGNHQIEDRNALDSSLTLRCEGSEGHADYKFKVSSPIDFQTVSPYGGCNQICEDQLSCGHPCKTVCHLMQIEHTKIKCNEPCERKCDAGLHSCKQKCFVKCGSSCMEMVQKNLPCGHQAMMRCHADEEHFFCTEIVTKKFPECNHEAEVACSCKRCPQPCDMKAPCGHSCTRKCHTDSDPDHLQYNCTKPCIKMNKDCQSNHPCNKKCWEECSVCEIQVKVKRSCGHQFVLKCYIDPEGIECRNKCAKLLDCGHRCLKKCNIECLPCTQLVGKVISECGHSAKVPCGREATKEDCAEQCKKLLSCGHACKAKCSEECTPNCREVVEPSVGGCGHKIKTLCLEKTKGLKADVMRCTAKCNTVLECGHTCGGTCRTCLQGRFHVPCKQKCTKEFLCGHKFPSECSEPCPPCQKKYHIVCDHNESHEITCGQPRNKFCKQKCSAKCDHGNKCTRKCGLDCNYSRCEEKCTKTLPCKHPCCGFCGSPCPGLCWECDKEELLQHAFPFGAEIPENAKFVLLPDCHHTIEAGALEAWFKWQSSQLEIKSCPLCKKKISAQLVQYKKEIWESFVDFIRICDKSNKEDHIDAKELME
ncbi:uncharacterized protein LOC132194601 isoform X2 [Neocloeon triangulifer]|uniref:uncharacterized protein LOC132194601 isoform X2 n=1 Tax=Neocloeon triangulifer TaxID=2078957 RepID=UPI00286F4854|nr:uncharacterized protein LOC132194601 isoform X2 [Neocloeon triangulifer]